MSDFIPDKPIDGGDAGCFECALSQAKDGLIVALVQALENNVSLARCLEVLGVEGKPATMLRAMLSRYSDEQLAEMLSGLANPSNEVSGTEAVLPLQ